MTRFKLSHRPRPLPLAHHEIARRLESLDIEVWTQGEALLDDLLPNQTTRPDHPGRPATRSFLCAVPAERLLQALPRAVVTAERRRRLSLGTRAGPIDLLPLGDRPTAEVLRRFGLSALSFAWRPARETWSEDPLEARNLFAQGRLDIVNGAAASNPFQDAPRRFWIAARLLAEYQLEASPRMIDAARVALPSCLPRLPLGASARREIQRIMLARSPASGLQFLHSVGICDALFPGIARHAAETVAALEPWPSVRWAAWLSGTATQKALRMLRMPPELANEIERLLRHHPIDRFTAAHGETGLRRIRQRLRPDEIEALLAWRRAELARGGEADEIGRSSDPLEALAARLEEFASERAATDRVRELAIDGRTAMQILDCGPGRRIGQALSHLAAFIQAHPDSNRPQALQAELLRWADRDRDPTP